MDRDAVLGYCGGRTGAVEDYPFGDDVAVFKVGGRVFALCSLAGRPGSVSLKCDPTLAEALRDRYPAVRPGYHLNKRHWNTIELDGSVYFGWESPTWGGGIAFYDPDAGGTSLGVAYLITAAQFADVATQEMRRDPIGDPLDLMALIIEASSEAGDVVWEPFGGLFSACLAARQLGRKAFGAELDPSYFQLAIAQRFGGTPLSRQTHPAR